MKFEIGVGSTALGLLLAGCGGTPRPLAGYVPPIAAVVPSEQAVLLPASSPIGAGDVVSITVFREPDLSLSSVTVDPSGTIGMPLLGTVTAAGASPAELAARIRTGLLRYVVDPRVSVNVTTSNSRPITVEGEVIQPGIFGYQNGMTLISAMAISKGPTPVARSQDVTVIRTTPTGRYLGVFDLEAIRAGRMPDVALQPQDYVVVGKSGGRQLWRDFLQTVPLIGIFARF